jgi:hypothetical protein
VSNNVHTTNSTQGPRLFGGGGHYAPNTCHLNKQKNYIHGVPFTEGLIALASSDTIR